MIKDIEIRSCLKRPKGQAYSSVFPNPVSGPFTIDVRLPAAGDISLKVYTIQGEEKWAAYYQNEDQVSPKIHGLDKGIYLVEVRYTASTEWHRLLVID